MEINLVKAYYIQICTSYMNSCCYMERLEAKMLAICSESSTFRPKSDTSELGCLNKWASFTIFSMTWVSITQFDSDKWFSNFSRIAAFWILVGTSINFQTSCNYGWQMSQQLCETVSSSQPKYLFRTFLRHSVKFLQYSFIVFLTEGLPTSELLK